MSSSGKLASSHSVVETRRQVLIAVCAVLLIAFFVRVIAWYLFPNQIWPDEIFQSLEQAHRVVFGYGMIPWEFRDGTRSWLLPGTLAAVMAATSVVSSSVTAYLGACAAFLSAISVASVWATFRSALASFGLRGAIVAGAVCSCWFELVYFAPKALNEVVAGNCLLIGALLADGCARRQRTGEQPAAVAIISASALLALASVLRMQLAIAALAAFAYMLWPLNGRDRWRAVVAGAAVVAFAGLLDWITWQYPFQSYIENLRINIVEQRSKLYGVAPWYAYFLVYGRIWRIWSVLILGLAALGARTRPILGVCALAVLAAHVPIAHKEYRFAYPAMALLIALAAFGSARAIQWLEQTRTPRIATLAAGGLVTIWLAASLQGAVGFHESKTRLATSYGTPEWHWTQSRGGLLSLKELGKDPTVCGVAAIGLDPFLTGGYTYLHRDIPFFHTLQREEIPKLAPYANVFLLYIKLVRQDTLGTFVLEQCISEVCVFRRPGACAVLPGYSFNRMLEEAGR